MQDSSGPVSSSSSMLAWRESRAAAALALLAAACVAWFGRSFAAPCLEDPCARAQGSNPIDYCFVWLLFELVLGTPPLNREISNVEFLSVYRVTEHLAVYIHFLDIKLRSSGYSTGHRGAIQLRGEVTSPPGGEVTSPPGGKVK